MDHFELNKAVSSADRRAVDSIFSLIPFLICKTNIEVQLLGISLCITRSNNDKSFIYKLEIGPFCSGSSGKSRSIGFGSGREGKERKFLRVKLCACRYLKKMGFG